MNKIIAGILVCGAAFVGFLGLHLGLSTMTEEPNYEPIAVDTSAEEDRLNYTYTIRDIVGFDSYSRGMKYKIFFEEYNLDKVHSTYVRFYANEEFGSTLKVGQKLTVKEIEENLIY